MTSLMATRVICDVMAHPGGTRPAAQKGEPSWLHDPCNMAVDQKWR